MKSFTQKIKELQEESPTLTPFFIGGNEVVWVQTAKTATEPSIIQHLNNKSKETMNHMKADLPKKVRRIKAKKDTTMKKESESSGTLTFDELLNRVVGIWNKTEGVTK